MDIVRKDIYLSHAIIDSVDPPLDFRDTDTINLTDWDTRTPHRGFNNLLKSKSKMIEFSSAPEIEVTKTKTAEYKSKRKKSGKAKDAKADPLNVSLNGIVNEKGADIETPEVAEKRSTAKETILSDHTDQLKISKKKIVNGDKRNDTEDVVPEDVVPEKQYWIATAEKKFNWNRAFIEEAKRWKKPADPIPWTEAGGKQNQSRIQNARTGDVVLAYQSSPRAGQIVGLARIDSAPYLNLVRGNYYAVDIFPLRLLDSSITLEMLKKAIPETEKVRIPSLVFAAVTPYEWSVIRELIRYHNPDLAPDELPSSQVPPTHQIVIDIDQPTDALDTMTVGVFLKNIGNTTWQEGLSLSINSNGINNAPSAARKEFHQRFSHIIEKAMLPGDSKKASVNFENTKDVSGGTYDVKWQATFQIGSELIESNPVTKKIVFPEIGKEPEVETTESPVKDESGEVQSGAAPDREGREKEDEFGKEAAIAPTFKVAPEYQPPPVDDTLSVEIYPTTVKLTFQGEEYTGPSKINKQDLIEARIDTRNYGELLFNSVIHSGVSEGGVSDRTTRDGYAVARNREQDGKQSLLIFELRLDPNDLALHRHRWEYIKHPDDPKPLALQKGFSFYRYQAGRADDLMVTARPLKILFAICNPTTLNEKGNNYLEQLEKLQVDQERKNIEMGLNRLRECQAAEYRILDRESGTPPTLTMIHEALKDGYHILHLLCHGVFIDYQRQTEFYLVMEKEDGTHDFISANDFNMLVSETNLRLVVLVSCSSALSFQNDTLRGLGPSLVRAGVPAVIAMQDYLPIETAQRFAQYFYDDLARSGQVDMAMAATRLSIHADEIANRSPKGTWGIPALFMSTNDGKLFDVDAEEVDRRLPALGTATVTPEAALADADQLGAWPSAIGLETAAPVTSPSYILSALSQPLQVAAASGMIPPPVQTEDRSEPMAQPQPRPIMSDALDLNANIIAEGAGSLRQFVSGEGGDSDSPKLELPPTMYAQVASALNTGKHIILIGPPGTGKTSLAKAICNYAEKKNLSRGTVYTTATADWTTFDTVGGYVPAVDQTLQFRPGSFLQAICHCHWLVIDEINRAEIDKAFGELFTVLSGQQVDLPYHVGKHQIRVLPPDDRTDKSWIPEESTDGDYGYVVHPNWRIVATMNVYDKSSLFNMSLAFMRRFAFVDVDLPDEETLYQTLRNDWIQEHDSLTQDAANQDVNTLTTNLTELLRPKTHLMSRRALGPAIVKDMIAYVGDRYLTNAADEPMLDLLAEAFLLYAVPQLDGLDRDGITEIYRELKQRFGPAADAKGILPRIMGLYPYIPPGEWEGTIKSGR